MGSGVSTDTGKKEPVRGGHYKPLEEVSRSDSKRSYSRNRRFFFGEQLGVVLAGELGFEHALFKPHAAVFLGRLSQPPFNEEEIESLKCLAEKPQDSTKYAAALVNIEQYEKGTSAEAVAQYEAAYRIVKKHKKTLTAVLEYNEALEILEIYRKSLVALKKWVGDRRISGIDLKAKHLNAAVKSIELREALPENCSDLLVDYLEIGVIPANFEEQIEDVSNRHALELTKLAKLRRQLHHSLPHALEIERRTKRLAKELGIWQADTARDKFLLSITSSLVLLHDYVQKISPQSLYESNEEETAAKVSSWLVTVLGIPEEGALPEQTNVRKLIELMAHRMIVGGTTSLFDKKMSASVDLIDFVSVLEESMDGNGAMITDPSNKTLIHDIDAVAKAIGVNDKTPGAVLINMVEQARDPELATIPLVRTHCRAGASRLDAFYKSAHFKPYYETEALRPYYNSEKDDALFKEQGGFSKAVNLQTLCTHIAPHISMPPEFLAEGNLNQNKLYQFMERCRTSYAESSEPGAFTEVFETAFEEYDMEAVLDAVFFRGIQFEQSFSTSQIAPLVRRESDLLSEGIDTSEIHRFVDSTVPQKDANNLSGLKEFYSSSSPANRAALSKELLMAVVLQAGQVLSLRLKPSADEEEEVIIPSFSR